MPSGSYWLVLADSGMAGFGKSNVQAADSDEAGHAFQ